MTDSLLQEIKLKIAKYCAYQERAPKEVLTKLKALGATEEQSHHLLQSLIDDNFVNIERFAKAYALDKFRFQKWGRQKIRFKLKAFALSKDEIEQGLDQIPEEEYKSLLRRLAHEKMRTLNAEIPLPVKRQKVLQYLTQKGFEFELIQELFSNRS